MGLNWKFPFSPFTYPITYKVGFLYFRSSCIKNTISNNTCQNFRDKRLVRPGSKYPIRQRSQLITYKAKFSQIDNIYLIDLKYNITYQNIRGSDQFLCPEKPTMTKKLFNNLHGWAFSKTVSLLKFTYNLLQFPSQKSDQT